MRVLTSDVKALQNLSLTSVLHIVRDSAVAFVSEGSVALHKGLLADHAAIVSRHPEHYVAGRGKVSEGLDFSDSAGRAVVITGIPFAMKTEAKVRLKREVLDENCRPNSRKRSAPGAALASGLTGEQWYLQQAARYLIQLPAFSAQSK